MYLHIFIYFKFWNIGIVIFTKRRSSGNGLYIKRKKIRMIDYGKIVIIKVV